MNERITFIDYAREQGYELKLDGTDSASLIDSLLLSIPNSDIYFPSGIYPFTYFPVKYSTKYVGAGRENTIFLFKGTTGTAFKSNAARIFYSTLSDFTIDCDNKADIGLDITGFDNFAIKDILIVKPKVAGVFGTSSRNSLYNTAVYSNEISNVKVWFSTIFLAGTYGFRIIDGANDNRFTNCISQNAYTGFSIEDNVNYTVDANCTSNVFLSCNPEPCHTGFYVDGEYNTILYPRIENFYHGVEFSTNVKCRNNIVTYPSFYNKQSGGDNFVNANTTKSNIYFYTNNLSEDYVITNQRLKMLASDGYSYLDLIGSGIGAIRGGQTGIQWAMQMSDTEYNVSAVSSGSFYKAFSIANNNTPVLNASNGIHFPSYTTAGRPTTLNGVALGNYSTHRGYTVFDETIGKLITWAGINWHDGAGNIV